MSPIRIIAAIVTLALTAAAFTAKAATLYSVSGTATQYGGYSVFGEVFYLPGAGNYTLTVSATAPVSMMLEAQYLYHYDTFIAPPPKDHSEYLEGNAEDLVPQYFYGISKTGSLMFEVPATTYRFFLDDGYFSDYGIEEGTPLYEEIKYEFPRFYIALEGEGGPFDYTVTVTTVPEASTWAVLIIGFGAVGTVLRRKRALTT